MTGRISKNDALEAEYEALKMDQATILEEVSKLRSELSLATVETGNLKSQLSILSLDYESVKSQLELMTRERDRLNLTVQQSSHYSQSSQIELETAASRWEQKFRESESHKRRLEDQV